MILSRREFDQDVKTSRADRGYTTYSDEYMFSEIKKINYNFDNVKK